MTSRLLDPATTRWIGLTLGFVSEVAGLGLFFGALRSQNPRNPLKISWRPGGWRPIAEHQMHFVGRGYTLYRTGLRLFTIGALIHALLLLLRR